MVIENVPGFVRGRHSMLEKVQRELDEIAVRTGVKYRLSVSVLDAADFGVPQHRQRAIIVALRSGCVFEPPPIVGNRPTAWDAIGDLALDDVPKMTGRWATLLPSIPEGSNYLHHTDKGQGLPLFGYRTRYWSFLLKLAKDRPSWTVPAQPGPSVGPFHWDNRPLARQELLRLQSFPANWIVEGSRRDQVKQIGNATPPLLAEHVGRAIARNLGRPVTGRFRFSIANSASTPRPKRTSKVPEAFLELSGDHVAHPGTGLGPNPRLV